MTKQLKTAEVFTEMCHHLLQAIYGARNLCRSCRSFFWEDKWEIDLHLESPGASYIKKGSGIAYDMCMKWLFIMGDMTTGCSEWTSELR